MHPTKEFWRVFLLAALACSAPQNAPATFRLYYTTDLHVSGGGDSQALSTKDAINAAASPGDLVMITGDNVEIGTVAQWTAFNSGYYSLLSPALAKLMCLGNHETVWTGTGGKQLYDQFIGPGQRHGVIDRTGADKWKVIVLDSVMWYHHDGRIPGHEMQWLKAQLDAATTAGQDIVVADHFAPYTPDFSGQRSIVNDRELFALLRQYNVKLFLSGHEHGPWAGCTAPCDRGPTMWTFGGVLNINQADAKHGNYGVYTFNGRSLSYAFVTTTVSTSTVPYTTANLYNAAGAAVYSLPPAQIVAATQSNTQAAYSPSVLSGAATFTKLRALGGSTGHYYKRPLVLGSTAYLGDTGGLAQGLDTVTGAVQWSANYDGEIIATPILYQGDLIWCTDKGEIHRVSGVSGLDVWTMHLGLGISTEPKVMGSSLAVGTPQGSVVFVDLASGVLLPQQFAASNTNQRSIGAMATNGSDLYFGDAGTTFYRINASGGLVWKKVIGASNYIRADPAAPLLLGSLVIITNKVGGQAVALNVADGTQAWSKALTNPEWGSAIAALGDVLVGDGNGALHRLNPATGAERSGWPVTVDAGQEVVGLEADPRYAYVSMGNASGSSGRVIAVNLATAAIAMKVQVSDRYNNGPLVCPVTAVNGVLYQAVLGGELWRIDCPTTYVTPTMTPSYTPYAGTPTSTFSSTPSPSITPTPSASPTMTSNCNTLFNGAESVAENGTWEGTQGTVSFVSTAVAPAGAVTQGGKCLKSSLVGVNNNWFDTIANIRGPFSPSDFTGLGQLKADIYVTAGMLAGASYNSMKIVADCASCTPAYYYEYISSDAPTLVVGPQTITWNINYASGAIPSGSPLSYINLIFSRSPGTVTGEIYLDNLRFVGNCFATSTYTPALSPTPTRTAPAGSPTGTGTATPSPSATPTWTTTRTATASNTPSSTASASPSPTPTRTPLATLTASATRTPTQTPMDSATVTVTATDVPPGSTLTVTPTASPSFTDSPSATPSTSVTDSPTSTASSTQTVSPSPTASSTQTVSPTPTAGLSPMASPTLTPTLTPTGGPIGTPSSTPTSSPSSTATLVSTPTLTALPATPTATSGPGTPAVPTATLEGALRVLNLVPVPNPQSGPGLVLAVQLESPADALEAEVYSPAMTLLVRDKHVGSYGAGWSRWTTADHGLGEGLYFFRARAFSGSRSSFWTKPQCLVVVR